MLPTSVEPRANTKTTFAQRVLSVNSFSVMSVRSSWRSTTSRGSAEAAAAKAMMREKCMMIVLFFSKVNEAYKTVEQTIQSR